MITDRQVDAARQVIATTIVDVLLRLNVRQQLPLKDLTAAARAALEAADRERQAETEEQLP